MKPRISSIAVICLAAIFFLAFTGCKKKDHRADDQISTYESEATEETEESGGVDIDVVLDVSSSMLTPDFTPNRIEGVKTVLKKFNANHTDDNIAITLFAGESVKAYSMNSDHSGLDSFIDKIKAGTLEDGTAIGDGIMTALNSNDSRQDLSAPHFMILITDGNNNLGSISPLSAAENAANLGVVIYVVGIDSEQGDLDEETLQKIAETTGGRYFRTTGMDALRQAFTEIDNLISE